MKKIDEIKSILEKHIQEIEERYKVTELGIFGSYVRGEQSETSDVDILVEFKESMGLLKFIEIENYLTDLLGVKVDLVMKSSLKPRIGKHILEEVVYL
jgi:predicted nucleotidyltransferase